MIYRSYFIRHLNNKKSCSLEKIYFQRKRILNTRLMAFTEEIFLEILEILLNLIKFNLRKFIKNHNI